MINDLRIKLKTILPIWLNKLLSQTYTSLLNYRYILWHLKIARVVNSTPFNPEAVFPSDF